MVSRSSQNCVRLRTDGVKPWSFAPGRLPWTTQRLAGCAARIINPLPNSTYAIDPELPRTQQMIELTATIGNDVQWNVNGMPVLPQRDGRFFWQLASGQWELKAIGQNGAAQEKITVE